MHIRIFYFAESEYTDMHSETTTGVAVDITDLHVKPYITESL